MPRRNKPKATQHQAARPTRTRDLLILGAILLVGLVPRAAYLSELVDKPDFDSPLSDAGYNDYWGRALVTGDWTPPANNSDPEIPSTPYFRPPGYPYFLALNYFLSGGSYLAPRIAQMMLGLLSCALVYLLGRVLYGRLVATCGALLTSIYWGFIYFEGELQPPALLVFLSLLLMHALRFWAVRTTYPRGVAVGLLTGLLALVRPNVLLFLPVLLIWCWWILHRTNAARRLPLTAAVVIAGTALAIAPATIRNYAVSREFVPISTNAGINLYIGNNEYTSLVIPRVPDIEQLAGRAGWSLFSYADIARGVERQQQRAMRRTELSSYFTARALGFIRLKPGIALGNVVKRALLMWGPREISNNKVLHYERKNSTTLRLLPGFPVAVSGFLIGLLAWLLDRRRERHNDKPRLPETKLQVEMTSLFLAFVVIYSSSFLPFLVAGRFRVPIIPFLLLLGGYGIARIVQHLQLRQIRPAGFYALGWVALWGLAHWSPVPYQPHEGAWYLDRANAYLNKGMLESAMAEYRAAALATPDYPGVYAEYGSLLAREGLYDQAIEYYRKSLELSPRQAELRRSLALALSRQGRYDEAISEYGAALVISPDNADAWYNLGRLLALRNRNSEAQQAYRRTLELTPDFAEARVNLGALLRNQGDTSAAIAQYRLAIASAPNLYEAHFNLTLALLDEGKVNEAIGSISTALHIKPRDPTALRVLKALQEQRRKATTRPANLGGGVPP